MNDVVICNFPPMLPWYLPNAPAILAGACRWLNLKASFVDFNIEYHKKNVDIDNWANIVLDKNPKLVALSIFSYKSRPYALELAKKLKQKNPSIKIIAGGAGLSDNINGELQADVIDYCKRSTIDHCIIGDGEYQFPLYLTNFFQLPTIEQFEPMSPPYYVDYTGYNFIFYKQQAKLNNTPIHIPFNGSRGCVRNCTFCAIPAKWNFIQRDPMDISIEIRNILSVESNVHIHFTDSLVNGSLPSFEKLLDLLIDIKKEYPNFTWGGQFIIRRVKQSTAEYWKKIADSGARLLEVGVETGSDRLRHEMQKYFTNADLTHSVEMMQQYGITCIFLMFTGMPTETEQDFNETLKLLTNLTEFKDTVIAQIELGFLTSVEIKTPLYETSVKDPNMILTKNTIIWYNKNNPELTFLERIARRKKFENHAKSCGYIVAWDTHLQIEEAEETYNKYYPIINLIEKQK